MSEIIERYDEKGNIIYRRDSEGHECWYEYDENNNCTHYRDSGGYEYWREYDERGNVTYYRDSGGYSRGTPRKEKVMSNERGCVERENEELRGVIETYGRAEVSRSEHRPVVEIWMAIDEDVFRAAGNVTPFGRAVQDAYKQLEAWLHQNPRTHGIQPTSKEKDDE